MIDTSPQARVPTLDILRGVAVMGILAMNAPGFTMPEPAYFNPAAYGGASGLDLAAWAANFVFFDGKMRGLFALLFGASLLLVVGRSAAAGDGGAKAHYSRMGWLLVFGAAHFYLIWWGDILLHYALVGLVAFLFVRLPMERLVGWIAVLLLLDVMMMASTAYSVLQASAAASAAGSDGPAMAALRSVTADFAPLDAPDLARDLAIHRGPWPELVAARWADHAAEPIQYLFFGGPETLALMLIGMALLRSGFLAGQWPSHRYRAIAAAGLLVGGAGFAAACAVMIVTRFDPAILFAATLGATPPFRLAMVLGYAALIILLARPGAWLVERIAAAGRAAFTNYLGTSLVMTTLSYQFGLYGRLGRAELWLLVVAAWAVMLLWSKPWLDRYRYGPFEWLWRSLARGRLQPMRRSGTLG